MCAVVSLPWWATRCLLNRTFRRLVWERLGFELKGLLQKGEAPRVLVHGVSVGEVKAAQALVEGLEQRGYDALGAAAPGGG